MQVVARCRPELVSCLAGDGIGAGSVGGGPAHLAVNDVGYGAAICGPGIGYRAAVRIVGRGRDGGDAGIVHDRRRGQQRRQDGRVIGPDGKFLFGEAPLGVGDPYTDGEHAGRNRRGPDGGLAAADYGAAGRVPGISQAGRGGGGHADQIGGRAGGDRGGRGRKRGYDGRGGDDHLHAAQRYGAQFIRRLAGNGVGAGGIRRGPAYLTRGDIGYGAAGGGPGVSKCAAVRLVGRSRDRRDFESIDYGRRGQQRRQDGRVIGPYGEALRRRPAEVVRDLHRDSVDARGRRGGPGHRISGAGYGAAARGPGVREAAGGGRGGDADQDGVRACGDRDGGGGERRNDRSRRDQHLHVTPYGGALVVRGFAGNGVGPGGVGRGPAHLAVNNAGDGAAGGRPGVGDGPVVRVEGRGGYGGNARIAHDRRRGREGREHGRVIGPDGEVLFGVAPLGIGYPYRDGEDAGGSGRGPGNRVAGAAYRAAGCGPGIGEAGGGRGGHADHAGDRPGGDRYGRGR